MSLTKQIALIWFIVLVLCCTVIGVLALTSDGVKHKPHTEVVMVVGGQQLQKLADATSYAVLCNGDVEFDHNTKQPGGIEILVGNCKNIIPPISQGAK